MDGPGNDTIETYRAPNGEEGRNLVPTTVACASPSAAKLKLLMSGSANSNSGAHDRSLRSTSTCTNTSCTGTIDVVMEDTHMPTDEDDVVDDCNSDEESHQDDDDDDDDNDGNMSLASDMSVENDDEYSYEYVASDDEQNKKKGAARRFGCTTSDEDDDDDDDSLGGGGGGGRRMAGNGRPMADRSYRYGDFASDDEHEVAAAAEEAIRGGKRPSTVVTPDAVHDSGNSAGKSSSVAARARKAASAAGATLTASVKKAASASRRTTGIPRASAAASSARSPAYAASAAAASSAGSSRGSTSKAKAGTNGSSNGAAAACNAPAVPTPICYDCHLERHAPVLSCDQINRWHQLSDSMTSGILTVPSANVEYCMTRRIEMVADILQLSTAGTAVLLRENGWDVNAVLTGDLLAMLRRSGVCNRCGTEGEAAAREAAAAAESSSSGGDNNGGSNGSNGSNGGAAVVAPPAAATATAAAPAASSSAPTGAPTAAPSRGSLAWRRWHGDGSGVDVAAEFRAAMAQHQDFPGANPGAGGSEDDQMAQAIEESIRSEEDRRQRRALEDSRRNGTALTIGRSGVPGFAPHLPPAGAAASAARSGSGAAGTVSGFSFSSFSSSKGSFSKAPSSKSNAKKSKKDLPLKEKKKNAREAFEAARKKALEASEKAARAQAEAEAAEEEEKKKKRAKTEPDATARGNETKKAGVEEKEKDEGGITCEICFNDQLTKEDILPFPCGHEYCRDCWTGLITSMLKTQGEDGGGGGDVDAILATTCPFVGCSECVTEEEVAELAPELMPAFQRLQLHSFVAGRGMDTVRWCPGPDCDHIAVRCREDLFDCVDQEQDIPSGVCGTCATAFCFRCGEAPHEEGETCANANAFDGSELAGKQPPYKHCPSCHVKIEKNGGCNHMRCKCGHHFCWICLGDYKGRHFCGREGDRGRRGPGQPQGDNANTPVTLNVGSNEGTDSNAGPPRTVPSFDLDFLFNTLGETKSPPDEAAREALQKFLKTKEEMDHFAHYYNRFAAHSQGQTYAESQSPCTENRVNDFSKMTDLKTATDCDFIRGANRMLVDCRRVLKYSYCYAYCNDDDVHKELFQVHQERLERFVEELSMLSEEAVTRVDRARVIDLIGIVDKCMRGILEFVEYGAAFVVKGRH